MTVQLTAEQESQLSEIAAQAGRAIDELAREAVDRYLAEEARFRSAVQAGVDAADRGEFLSPSEVWARVERELEA
jgi:predicted transcriptional regulator